MITNLFMRKVKRLFVLACVCLASASTVTVAYSPPDSARSKYNFNSGWKVFVGDPAGAEAPGFDDSGVEAT